MMPVVMVAGVQGLGREGSNVSAYVNGFKAEPGWRGVNARFTAPLIFSSK
jgi:hypothetical protein